MILLLIQLMNEYYLDIVKKKLLHDVINELSFENIDKKIVINELNQYLQKKEIFKKEKKEEEQCKARIWNDGYGGRCLFTGTCNGFCKKHSKEGNDWWLGTIDEPRPERPIHKNGKLHVWLDNKC